jgi:hypothetical protein
MALTWWHVVGLTFLATILFFVLGQTKLGMMINTIIFMLLIAAALVASKVVSESMTLQRLQY